MTAIQDDTPEYIDIHEQPRYTTRRLRYEIDKAILAERQRCAEVALNCSQLNYASPLFVAVLADWRIQVSKTILTPSP